jgi:PAS domain S-box-containing protein
MKTKTKLKILMLEDDSLDLELNKAQLQLLDEYDCHVLWVKDRLSYLSAIQNFAPDIILSDYNLPQYNGLNALVDLQKLNLVIPFIFVTGTLNEETAASTIKNGAWDYVVKDRLFRLPLAIRSALHLKDERIMTAKTQEQNRILSMSLEQSPVHVIISNIDGTIEYVNNRFTEVTGYTSDEVIGQNMRLHVPGVETINIWGNIWNTIKQGNKWRGETESIKRNGDHFWESVSISPLKNEEGKITHYITVKEDITHRKKIEQEVREALDRAERSDRLKEAFLQNLSHEIRTPMNAIVGFSGLLTEPSNDIEIIQEYAQIIQNSSAKLLSIVTDILTIARIQTGQERVITRPVYVNEIIDKLYADFITLAENKKLLLVAQKDTSNPMPVIITDETKLTQILSNLLQNAIKFTNTGLVEIGYSLHDNLITFYVKDTGIGIPTEAMDLIFERFRQADPSQSVTYGGTGLGLSICKSYATMLGGQIKVESEANKGSTFFLTLPYQYHHQPMA